MYSDPNLMGVRADRLPGATYDPLLPEVGSGHDCGCTAGLHEAGPIDYASLGYGNPPTYGPHHTTMLPTGIYTTPQDDADVVENLEDGHVWISYNASLPSAQVQALQQLVAAFGSHVGIVLTPRPDDPAPIELASWAHLMPLDQVDVNLIREFIITNRAHGPDVFMMA
jgi:hypothetical protein